MRGSDMPRGRYIITNNDAKSMYFSFLPSRILARVRPSALLAQCRPETKVSTCDTSMVAQPDQNCGQAISLCQVTRPTGPPVPVRSPNQNFYIYRSRRALTGRVGRACRLGFSWKYGCGEKPRRCRANYLKVVEFFLQWNGSCRAAQSSRQGEFSGLGSCAFSSQAGFLEPCQAY